MLNRIQRKYALSEHGAIGLIKGCFGCFLQNISFMLPVFILYSLVRNLLAGTPIREHIYFYILSSIGFIAFIFIATYIQYNSTYLETYIESGVRRITLAEKLRKIPLSFFAHRDLSDLTSTIMSDSAVLETSFSHFIPELVGSIVSTTLIALALFFFNWQMALAALWVLPISFLIVVASAKLQDRISKKMLEEKLALAAGIQECIEAMKDLRANNAENDYLRGLDDNLERVEKRVIVNEFTVASFVTGASLILKLGIATVALTGSILLSSGRLDLLTFIAFLIVVSRLYDPLQDSLKSLAAIINTRANINRMNEILNHEIQQGDDKLTNNGYDIEFKNVDFSYNAGEKILKDVSFIAKQGEVTALVGPSGGGKTTVSRLASRFWDIDKGTISVGGMDISRIDPEKLMSLYSIVFQDVTLFDNSVIENIRIGDKNATDDEVIAAARLANCEEFVEKLPDKWNTEIGENGIELSGGERQRISIARAFLKNAPIILLDEATASLDVENESRIQTALSRLIKDKTVLVIAHRMRTIANADKIVVLSEGEVKEIGTPDELLKRDGIYAKMVKLQREGQSWMLR